MFFVSVIRAPDKRARWPGVDSINTEMRRYATSAKNVEFIDVNPVLVDSQGEVRGALYLPDSLHYKPETYALFTQAIRPVIERCVANLAALQRVARGLSDRWRDGSGIAGFVNLMEAQIAARGAAA